MKKLILLLLFIPLLSFGQNLIEDNIEPFKELIGDPMYIENRGQNKSFFKGHWIDKLGVLKLSEKIFLGLQFLVLDIPRISDPIIQTLETITPCF